jgi:AcrR family transcriptional regulator
LTIDRRTLRRQETHAEIVRASWDVVREHGLAGLSMRDLGERVGMRAQSVYSYFASKHEIYDAMFLEGYQAFADRMDRAVTDDDIATDPLAAARNGAHAFVDFCVGDPVRYQLLFQRTIPGFTPSDESWAVAVQVYEQMARQLAAIGVHEREMLDLWTAVMTGLTDQQISNDPGGTRWTRLVDRAVDMLMTENTSPAEAR